MGLYRLYVSGEEAAVGVIVAGNNKIANAFAQGKYGAGASAVRVDYKTVLENGGVCEVLNTESRRDNHFKQYRVVST